MKVTITFQDLENVEIDGVDPRDYPDFCDAFISYAELNGIALNETELEWVNDSFQEDINEMAYMSLI